MKQPFYAVSASVTSGINTETHDHDRDYRATLDHVTQPEAGVYELVPYSASYKEQINAFARPYIDRYNAKRADDYLAAKARFESGQLQTRPLKKDYKPMDYDFYARESRKKHRNPKTGKREMKAPYRSWIIGLGDQEDRVSGRITLKQALSVFSALIQAFKERFKDFLLMSAVVHADESGYWHMHMCYMPVFFGAKKDLEFGIGLDKALEHAGFRKEKSIFAAANEKASMFSAMRNWFYRTLERILPEHGLLLDLGVTARKMPWMNPSKRVTQESWKEVQDTFVKMNQLVNEARQTLKEATFGEKDIFTVAAANNELNNLLAKIQGRSKLFGKDEYHLDAKTYEGIWEAFEKEREISQLLLHKAERFYKRVQELEQENEQLQYDLKDRERDCAILEAQLRQQGRDVQLPDLYRAER